MRKTVSVDLCFDLNLEDANLLLSSIASMPLSDNSLKEYLLRQLGYAVREFDPPVAQRVTPVKKWKKW